MEFHGDTIATINTHTATGIFSIAVHGGVFYSPGENASTRLVYIDFAKLRIRLNFIDGLSQIR